jgi:hypothetical protein
VPNPSGRGNAQPDSRTTPGDPEETASDGSGEQVYVPGTDETREAEGAGAADAGGSDDVNTEGVEGRAGEGEGNGAQLSSTTGAGGAVRVQTPYREVIAEYARQATEALDRAYVPSDAKEYVREYFSELGK